MSKKTYGLMIGLGLCITAPSLTALSVHTSSKTADNNNQNNDTNEQDVDVWFGPGFYYGIWFDNESDYWKWRGNHQDYPPNHNYYNHDHPIQYNHNDRQGGSKGGGNDNQPPRGSGGRGGGSSGHGGGGGGHR